eukprot:2305782-Alexandrium_andersonii.AAC.1
MRSCRSAPAAERSAGKGGLQAGPLRQGWQGWQGRQGLEGRRQPPPRSWEGGAAGPAESPAGTPQGAAERPACPP